MKVTVLIADDFPLMREGLAAAIDRHPDIEVVGIAADGVECVEQALLLRPHVVVLDLRMPRLSGLMALRTLGAELPETRVLVLSASESPERVMNAIAAGASGYLSKRSAWNEVCAAILATHRGDAVVSPALAAHLLDAYRRGAGQPDQGAVGQLAGRELDILRLIADGATDHEISDSLYVSPRTVQSDLARIRRKTGVRRRAELARWATENLVT